MSKTLAHVQRGFGSVRPYLHGPSDLPSFLQKTFDAAVLETNQDGPTLLQIGDSLVWVEAGELPPGVAPGLARSTSTWRTSIRSTRAPSISGHAASPRRKTSPTTSARRASSIEEGIRGGCRPTGDRRGERRWARLRRKDEPVAMRLNHAIVAARDGGGAARFVAEILGLPAPVRVGPFTLVQMGDTSLDFVDSTRDRGPHYAFLVNEDEFDGSSPGSANATSRTGPTHTEKSAGASMPGTAGAECTSTTRTVTCWKSSPGHTEAAGRPRRTSIRCSRRAGETRRVGCEAAPQRAMWSVTPIVDTGR